MTEDDSRNGHRRHMPEHSEHVALELAALLASAPSAAAEAPVALVVVSDADVNDYVSGSLRQGIALDVVATPSVASALDAAARCKPRVLVAAYAERAVLRHLPGVPAVLLSDDVPAADVTSARRLAPLIVLRGAYRVERLVAVVVSLISGNGGHLP